MPIYLDEALGAELDPIEFSWTASDVQLYHLMLGAGADPGTGYRGAAADPAAAGLLHRLCGDRNPLHSDPEFAAAAGFPRPILHGLCTYGTACKAIIDTYLDADVSLVHFYGARFAGVVFPGERLRAHTWKDNDKLLATVTAPSRDDAAVLSGVQLTAA